MNSSGQGSSNSSGQREERRREAEVDRALVQRAQRGDQSAFRSLVERHERRAFAVAVGLVRDEQDAREIVQEAFIRVHRNLAKFEGSSAFFTWFYRIVKNLAIDHMRKPARRESEPIDDPSVVDGGPHLPFIARLEGTDPNEVVKRREIAARIQQALDALPPYHRAVIIMREVEGMSYQEMADAMEVSKGTIMSRLFHARQKLQLALADCFRDQLGRDPKGK
ncbi:MAG: sigma-70 family RNA polymerase sigma factor [Myxococcota bacterium]